MLVSRALRFLVYGTMALTLAVVSYVSWWPGGQKLLGQTCPSGQVYCGIVCCPSGASCVGNVCFIGGSSSATGGGTGQMCQMGSCMADYMCSMTGGTCGGVCQLGQQVGCCCLVGSNQSSTGGGGTSDASSSAPASSSAAGNSSSAPASSSAAGNSSSAPACSADGTCSPLPGGGPSTCGQAANGSCVYRDYTCQTSTNSCVIEIFPCTCPSSGASSSAAAGNSSSAAPASSSARSSSRRSSASSLNCDQGVGCTLHCVNSVCTLVEGDTLSDCGPEGSQCGQASSCPQATQCAIQNYCTDGGGTCQGSCNLGEGAPAACCCKSGNQSSTGQSNSSSARSSSKKSSSARSCAGQEPTCDTGSPFCCKNGQWACWDPDENCTIVARAGNAAPQRPSIFARIWHGLTAPARTVNNTLQEIPGAVLTGQIAPGYQQVGTATCKNGTPTCATGQVMCSPGIDGGTSATCTWAAGYWGPVPCC